MKPIAPERRRRVKDTRPDAHIRVLKSIDPGLSDSQKEKIPPAARDVSHEPGGAGLTATILRIPHASMDSVVDTCYDDSYWCRPFSRTSRKDADCRILVEWLNMTGSLRPHIRAKVGAVAEVKSLLRATKCRFFGLGERHESGRQPRSTRSR